MFFLEKKKQQIKSTCCNLEVERCFFRTKSQHLGLNDFKVQIKGNFGYKIWMNWDSIESRELLGHLEWDKIRGPPNPQLEVWRSLILRHTHK